jgi:hypothetical protein
MKMVRKISVLLFSLCLLIGISYQISNGAPVTIADFPDFPAYPYNTGAYWSYLSAYVGCGPTTGAMILGYFQNREGYSNLLTPPTPAGDDQGLTTALALHGGAYMQTGTNGFGSVYRIEPGLEGYVADRSPEVIGTNLHNYSVNVMIHVAPAYNPPVAWLDAYGPFGISWMNDGDFWVQDVALNWHIDPDLFRTWTTAMLLAGIPIFLTIDQDPIEGGDHWVPMVGVDDTLELYYYYDTFDTSIHSGPIIYNEDTVGVGGDHAITFLRTVQLTDVITPITDGRIPEPTTILLLGSGLLGFVGYGRKKFFKN